jgi:hypothetical protein
VRRGALDANVENCTKSAFLDGPTVESHHRHGAQANDCEHHEDGAIGADFNTSAPDRAATSLRLAAMTVGSANSGNEDGCENYRV